LPSVAVRAPSAEYDGELQVLRAGDPASPALFLVHGLGQRASADFAPILEALAAHYYVIAPDLPGFGASPAAGHSFHPSDYAELVAHLVATRVREQGHPVELLGHSMGGTIAALVAGRHPELVERLILVDAAGILHREAYAASQFIDPLRGQAAHADVLRAKLGLLEAREDDLTLAAGLFAQMADAHVDCTLAFRHLVDAASDDAPGASRFVALFPEPQPIGAWLTAWRARLDAEPSDRAAQRETMRCANPAFIPRNHHVEAALAAAEEGDLAPFERLLTVLARPYDDQPNHAELAEPPGEEQWRFQTFCGT